MALEELKDLANALQSLAVAVAVLVGGGWALFRYFSLRAIQHAKAGLEKTRLELERARRTLNERGIIEITLEAEQMLIGNDHLIGVYVELRNTGNGTEIVDWSSSFIGAKKVICESDGSVRFQGDWILGTRPEKLVYSNIVQGELNKNSFIIRVPDSGIYYLHFESACSLQEMKLVHAEQEEAGIWVSEAPVVWSTAIFFQVKDIVD